MTLLHLSIILLLSDSHGKEFTGSQQCGYPGNESQQSSTSAKIPMTVSGSYFQCEDNDT